MVHVPLQPCHGDALPSHNSSTEVSLPLTQPLPFWLSYVRDFLIPSWNLLLQDYYHTWKVILWKEAGCARPMPGSVDREPALILPLMWYVTLAGHFSLGSFFLFSTEVKLLDLKVSESFISSDILGFMYSRLNHIKLLCFWAKNSRISAGEYFTSYKPQASTFHCSVWFLFKKSPWGSPKGPIETYVFMYSKNLKDYFDISFLWGEGLWVMLPFYFKILCTICFIWP